MTKKGKTMNILFLSLANYDSIDERGIYSDLLRKFVSDGNKVYLIAPIERRLNKKPSIIEENSSTIVKVNIFNMQKTNVVEKGISMLTIDGIFRRAIKQHFSDVKFDLVLYPTPPITLLNSIQYVKKRDHAKTYLLLKDIFPQNAVDIGLMNKKGVKGIIYRYFRRKEQKLYQISDYIGCMSKANVDYLIKHNIDIDKHKIDVCPNSIDPVDLSCDSTERAAIRKKYNIPLDKTVFLYGGNLGKPQGIDFVIECLNKCQSISEAFFLIVGSGTDFFKIENYIDTHKPSNVKLLSFLPKEDYDRMVGSCDIGMIFLDYRFTIPNYPSRLLAYMQARIPVLACTDSSTDIGNDILSGNMGWWCESNNSDKFVSTVEHIVLSDFSKMGNNAYKYLEENFTAESSYQTIIKRVKNQWH